MDRIPAIYTIFLVAMIAVSYLIISKEPGSAFTSPDLHQQQSDVYRLKAELQ